MPDIAEGEVVEVQGSAKLPYKLRNIGGVYSCSCPAWCNVGGGIERRTCKHLKAYRGAEAELARIGSDAPGMAGAVKPTKVKKAAGAAGGGDDDDADGPPVLLAHKWENDIDPRGWWMSEKLDGVRAWWTGTEFMSRLGNKFFAPSWFTASLPPHLLDGELWLGRKEFNECVSIVRRQDEGPQWKKIKYLVFDAPHLKTSFEERVAFMKAWHASLADASMVQVVEHVFCEGTAHLRSELERVEGLGGEGLMMRKPGSKYESGRSTSLLKVKTFHDAEGRVIDHEPGKGKHKGRLGALVVQMPNGIKFNVGTGFTDDERKDPPPLGTIITYRYQELTKDGVPRFPSWVGLAIDKAAPTAPSSAPLPSIKPVTTTTPPAPVVASKPLEVKKPAVSEVVEATKPPPRPQMSTAGTQRFVCTEGGSQKFWEVTVDGAAHTVRFGKVSTPGQERTKTFASAAAARDDADKLIKDKTGKGYAPA
ncbi:MAG: DNA ligase [Deltaproteobacteria bacterium]|nr:DNA ligase [Deltaproteobacteria bacterium]